MRAWIDSKLLWNNTGIKIYAGSTYIFCVSEGQYWQDWWVKTDANGFDMWYMTPFKKLLRYPNAKWLTLIGTIDHCYTFVIGKNTILRAPISGELICYANDAAKFYKNNKGSIELLITEYV